MLHERLRWLIAYNLLSFLFIALRIEKDDGGWAKYAKTLEERLVIRVVGRHVRLQQDKGLQTSNNSGVTEGIVLHLLA